MGGRAQEGGQSVSLSAGTGRDGAVTAWGALVGGRRKRKDWAELEVCWGGRWCWVDRYGWSLHLERDCPEKALSYVSFQQGEDIFMVPVSALVIPPEEEAVVCDSSEAASAGYTGRQCSTGACEMKGFLGWGEDFLCSVCASCWRYDQQCPFHCRYKPSRS